MKTREKLTEDYEDSLFRHLMAEFAGQEGQRLLTENERLKAAGDLPPDTDKKCRDAIRRALAKKRRRERLYAAGKMAKRAACILFYAAAVSWVIIMVKTYRLTPEKGAAVRANAQYYAAVRNALDEYGLDGVPVPTWYPDRMIMEGPDVYLNNFAGILYAEFRGENGKSFFFSATREWNGAAFPDMMPGLAGSPDEWYDSSIGTVYFLFNGDGTRTAIWGEGNVCVRIGGSLTVDELKTIIDSMRFDD